jgi:hypothetical protein
MSNPKPERGAPREPHNIPIRIQGAERSYVDDPEYRALLRDVRFLIEDARRRGVLPPASDRKQIATSASQPTAKRRRPARRRMRKEF